MIQENWQQKYYLILNIFCCAISHLISLQAVAAPTNCVHLPAKIDFGFYILAPISPSYNYPMLSSPAHSKNEIIIESLLAASICFLHGQTWKDLLQFKELQNSMTKCLRFYKFLLHYTNVFLVKIFWFKTNLHSLLHWQEVQLRCCHKFQPSQYYHETRYYRRMMKE